MKLAQVPKDLFTSVTKPSHFKVGAAFYTLADENGEVPPISTKELAAYSGVSESSLTRAFRELEEKGFLETIRTRKGFNKFYLNKYKVRLDEEQSVLPKNELGTSEQVPDDIQECFSSGIAVDVKLSDGVVTKDVFSSLTPERSTHEQLVQDIAGKPTNSKDSEILRISSSRKILEESPKSVLNSDAPKMSATLSVNPRDFRTRGRRPINEWTSWDVAAEFSDRLQRKLRGYPVVINKKKVEGALRSLRSSSGTTPKVEMMLMKMFFEDKSKWSLAKKEPHKVIGAYLNLFKTDLEGLKRRVEQEHVPSCTYASDGREFDNSIPGRWRRDKYEEKLRLSAATTN